MQFGDWMRLVAKNQFRVHPSRWGLAATITGLSVANSAMSLLNRGCYQSRLAQTRLVDDPVFIIGHWRSGTTYLHELMSCDDRFATPTNYQCFVPNYFLLTESWLPKLIWFLMPSQRPMDNVRTAWSTPQEDEFAIAAMGVPSPYLRIAFPNNAHRYFEYLDLESLSPSELENWHRHLRRFLKSLTISTNKRLILKSPTHTARVGVLAKEYPRARFLHIVRHPVTVYLSTINLWRVLDESQGLQKPREDYLKPYVLEAFERMYQAFERQRQQLAPGQLAEIRYEDLVKDPSGILRQAYQQLDLGDYSVVEPAIRELVKSSGDYKTNQYAVDDATREEIMTRWAAFASRYGYSS